jgi:2-polyprenyl-3-methyl-5-hydroxy-6-metoxy-1,4-benzoquinol methylase
MQKTKVQKHFDTVAKNYDFYKKKNAFYYSNLKNLLKTLISENKIVFEVGCGTGDLLASLNPKAGYGMDLSSEMIRLAKMKYKDKKNLRFFSHLPFTINLSPDFIFMCDVIEHLENPEETFNKISKSMNDKSTFICTMANPIWEPILMTAEKLGLKMPEGPHTRLKNEELRIMMENVGLKVVKHDYKLLIPVRIPMITNFANKYLEKPFNRLAFIEYFVAVKV